MVRMDRSRPPPLGRAPKIAVVGCGDWGANHIREWGQLGLLSLLCDQDSDKLTKAASSCAGPVDSVRSFDEAIGRDNIDGVVIATPSTTHAALAIKALEAGKHVLVEKPMATNIEDARAMAQSAVKASRTLMIGHVLEYHPAFLKIRELVEKDAFGALRYLYAHRLNYGKFRTEENALWSFAPHDIALLLRLLGHSPKRVTCEGVGYMNREVADVTLTNLLFKNDISAHIFASWLHPFKEHRFVVVGEKQMAVFDDTAAQIDKLLIFPHSVDLSQGLPLARKASALRVPIDSFTPLRRECEEFARCIEQGATPLTDAPSGIAVMEVLTEAQKSLANTSAPHREHSPTLLT